MCIRGPLDLACPDCREFDWDDEDGYLLCEGFLKEERCPGKTDVDAGEIREYKCDDCVAQYVAETANPMYTYKQQRDVCIAYWDVENEVPQFDFPGLHTEQIHAGREPEK